MSPRDRCPPRTPSPRQPSGKDPWNQWTTYNLILLKLEQTTGLSGRRGTGPPTESGFSQGFFSILSPMEFWFLAAVASGLLSWGHFISSNIYLRYLQRQQYLDSTRCRIQKLVINPETSLSRLVSGFICSCAVRMTC